MMICRFHHHQSTSHMFELEASFLHFSLLAPRVAADAAI
jgi:hypothetical protein